MIRKCKEKQAIMLIIVSGQADLKTTVLCGGPACGTKSNSSDDAQNTDTETLSKQLHKRASNIVS
jgi:hypothetical protein